MSEEARTAMSRRVLVVDDHEMVRAGMRALLACQPWVSRCLGAATSDVARKLARSYEPHVALIDLFIGADFGIELCKTLVDADPRIQVLLMSGLGEVSPAVARSAGACGFIPKHLSAIAVVEAVRRASGGRTVFVREEEPASLGRLSKRERDVLQHLVRGSTNSEAAAALHLSHHTVKQHAGMVYRKLGVRNRAEAASRAHQLGLVASV